MSKRNGTSLTCNPLNYQRTNKKQVLIVDAAKGQASGKSLTQLLVTFWSLARSKISRQINPSAAYHHGQFLASALRALEPPHHLAMRHVAELFALSLGLRFDP